MKFLDLLTLLFIGLKLANIINWYWIWVLSPLWLSVVFFVILELVNNKEKRDWLKRINRYK